MFWFTRVGLLGFYFLFSFHSFAETSESSRHVSFDDQRVSQCATLIQALSPEIASSDIEHLVEISDHLIVRKNSRLVSSEHIHFLLDLFYQETTNREAFVDYVQFLGIANRVWSLDERGEFKTQLGTQAQSIEEGFGAAQKLKRSKFFQKPRSYFSVAFVGWLALFFAADNFDEQTQHFNEQTRPILYTAYLSDQLTSQRVFFSKQDSLEKDLQKIWKSSSVSFPENLFLMSSSSDETTEGQEFVADFYSSNTDSSARQSATYGFRQKYEQFEEAGFEIIEIIMYENYRDQGKKLFVEIGSIDGRLKKIFFYKPEKGLQELLYKDYKDY